MSEDDEKHVRHTEDIPDVVEITEEEFEEEPIETEEPGLEEKYEKVIRIIECINKKIDIAKYHYFQLICNGQGNTSAAALYSRNVKVLSCHLKYFARKAALLQAEDEEKVWEDIPLATSLEEDYMELC